MAYPEHMKAQVEQVKKIVDSYMLIVKKTFKYVVIQLKIII